MSTLQSITLPASLSGVSLGACSGTTKRASSRSKFAVRVVANVAREIDAAQVKPQGDRVLLKLGPKEEKSVGGVLLPSQAVKYDRFLVGEVLSVGPEVADLSAGQKVMVSDLNAYEVALGSGSDKFVFSRASDLLAVVEN